VIGIKRLSMFRPDLLVNTEIKYIKNIGKNIEEHKVKVNNGSIVGFPLGVSPSSQEVLFGHLTYGVEFKGKLIVIKGIASRGFEFTLTNDQIYPYDVFSEYGREFCELNWKGSKNKLYTLTDLDEGSENLLKAIYKNIKMRKLFMNNELAVSIKNEEICLITKDGSTGMYFAIDFFRFFFL